MTKGEKIKLHQAFWNGQGPSLILIPTSDLQLYDTQNYRERFYSPQKMWEKEMERARPVADWPTDGIPTVRPNLGVIFIPGMAGQNYKITDGQMPWPGDALDENAIRAIRAVDVTRSELMRLAAEFYHIHIRSGRDEIATYHPDTQGVFDIAHLLYGEQIFLDILDESKTRWIHELLDICLDLMLQAVRHIKELLGEADKAMIHGHATQQGVYFPHAGLRIAEDTTTLISPKTIERFVMPSIEGSLEPFGGAFVHFCGKHPFLFERLCSCERVRAIDLGNPEKYDLRWILAQCARTHTVLYSRMTAERDEDWRSYTKRLAGLVKETGARCILRPLVFPESKTDCAAMQQLWHDLTA